MTCCVGLTVLSEGRGGGAVNNLSGICVRKKTLVLFEDVNPVFSGQS